MQLGFIKFDELWEIPLACNRRGILYTFAPAFCIHLNVLVVLTARGNLSHSSLCPVPPLTKQRSWSFLENHDFRSWCGNEARDGWGVMAQPPLCSSAPHQHTAWDRTPLQVLGFLSSLLAILRMVPRWLAASSLPPAHWYLRLLAV